MIKTFFLSKQWGLWAYGGAILLILSLTFQVWLTVLINTWYGEFYDIMQKPSQHTIGEFWDKMWMFFYIASPYVIVATVTNWFTRMYGFAWREALTFDYLPRWKNVESEIEGASQRIQEDTYKFARIVEGLGLSVVRAIMTLIAFLPILWSMSINVYEIPLLRDIPGSLVWVALVVSLGGIVISWFVGWFLPGLEYRNQVREAAFRKELVYVEDDKARYGEETMTSLFTSVKLNYRRLFNHYGYFDIWMNSYDQVMMLIPYIVVGPSVMTSAITLGVLVQVSNAFRKVHESFALVLHRWTDITELRSIWKRLHEFERNLIKYHPAP